MGWTILFWTFASLGGIIIAAAIVCLGAYLWARIDDYLYRRDWKKRQAEQERKNQEERVRHQAAPVKCTYRDEWMIYVFKTEAFIYKGLDKETQVRQHLGKLSGTDFASTQRAAEKAIDKQVHANEVTDLVYNTFCNYYSEHPVFVEDVVKAVVTRPTHFVIFDVIDVEYLADAIASACIKSPELFEELKAEFTADIKAANDEKNKPDDDAE